MKNNALIQRYEKLDPSGHPFKKVSGKIHLRTIRAKHKELGGIEDAISLRFDLYGGKSVNRIRLGFTGDTGWHAGLKSFYDDIDILVVHLGSIKRYELVEAKFYKSHLGILGVFKLIEDIRRDKEPQTVIISEFGEELIGIRDVLGTELGDKFPEMTIFPGDIGHTVTLEQGDPSIICGHEKCEKLAVCFYEQDGEIRVRCEDHKTTLGSFPNPVKSIPGGRPPWISGL